MTGQDCYPYCGKNDQNVGKPGQSIKRPRKGFGRFSGKFMHSANHTKRITDSRAYAKNLEQLRETPSSTYSLIQSLYMSLYCFVLDRYMSI